VFLYPYKFAREFKVIMFPLDKILELIPCNDRNFNVVIEAMPGCDMRKPIDIMLFNGPGGGDCNVTFKVAIKSLSLEAKNGSFSNVGVPTTSTTLSSSGAIAIMKLSSPTNDLQLWFCTLIFKEDYARIRI
jgi:hypothetical protein